MQLKSNGVRARSRDLFLDFGIPFIRITPRNFYAYARHNTTPLCSNRTSRITSTLRVTYATMACGRRLRHTHGQLPVDFHLVVMMLIRLTVGVRLMVSGSGLVLMGLVPYIRNYVHNKSVDQIHCYCRSDLTQFTAWRVLQLVCI